MGTGRCPQSRSGPSSPLHPEGGGKGRVRLRWRTLSLRGLSRMDAECRALGVFASTASWAVGSEPRSTRDISASLAGGVEYRCHQYHPRSRKRTVGTSARTSEVASCDLPQGRSLLFAATCAEPGWTDGDPAAVDPQSSLAQTHRSFISLQDTELSSDILGIDQQIAACRALKQIGDAGPRTRRGRRHRRDGDAGIHDLHLKVAEQQTGVRIITLAERSPDLLDLVGRVGNRSSSEMRGASSKPNGKSWENCSNPCRHCRNGNGEQYH